MPQFNCWVNSYSEIHKHNATRSLSRIGSAVVCSFLRLYDRSHSPYHGKYKVNITFKHFYLFLLLNNLNPSRSRGTPLRFWKKRLPYIKMKTEYLNLLKISVRERAWKQHQQPSLNYFKGKNNEEVCITLNKEYSVNSRKADEWNIFIRFQR